MGTEPRIARMTRMGRYEFLLSEITVMAAAHSRHSRNSRLKVVLSKGGL